MVTAMVAARVPSGIRSFPGNALIHFVVAGTPTDYPWAQDEPVDATDKAHEECQPAARSTHVVSFSRSSQRRKWRDSAARSVARAPASEVTGTCPAALNT